VSALFATQDPVIALIASLGLALAINLQKCQGLAQKKL
jgi:hypothetical protein